MKTPLIKANEAWAQVRRAARNGLYHAKEEFSLLPKDIQTVIVSASYLHDLALDKHINLSIEKMLFVNAYIELLQAKEQKPGNTVFEKQEPDQK